MEPLSFAIGFTAGAALAAGAGLWLARRRPAGPDEAEVRGLLARAVEELQRQGEEGRTAVRTERLEVERTLGPVRETLERLQRRTDDMEKSRSEAYGDLKSGVAKLGERALQLERETRGLSGALRTTRAGGRWGEVALRNVVELAGMTEHCDFDEQRSLGKGAGRPDLVVNLPGGRAVAVDAKVSAGDYLASCEADDEEARGAALDRHVKAIEAHVKTLAGRSYARDLPGDIDLVVLFLPAESLLAAAFSRAPGLLESALRKKVLIATPTSLLALLRTLSLYWRQENVAQNAEEVANAARELYERIAKFAEHLSKSGAALEKAVKSHNEAVGSFERRVVPQGRRLETLGAAEGAGRELEAPRALEVAVRKG